MGIVRYAQVAGKCVLSSGSMPDWLPLAAGVTAGVVLLAAVILWLVAERGHALLPSTWALMRAAGLHRLLDPLFWEGYYAGRWTNRYVRLLIDDGSALVNRVPFLWPAARKWLGRRYHAKVVPFEQARKIIELDKDIPLQDLEQIIPYDKARDLVLKAPPDIVLYDCACRARKENPCEPTMVCLVIGQPFADFVLEHNPDTSRRITTEEAMTILREEHERGHMHAAWFRRICLDRFYCICNCCGCCCAGIEGMVRHGTPMMTPSGYVSHVDGELCAGCGTCATLCPWHAREVVDGVAVRDWDRCMGCGACTAKCGTGASTLDLDEGKGIPLNVDELTGPGS